MVQICNLRCFSEPDINLPTRIPYWMFILIHKFNNFYLCILDKQRAIKILMLVTSMATSMNSAHNIWLASSTNTYLIRSIRINLKFVFNIIHFAVRIYVHLLSICYREKLKIGVMSHREMHTTTCALTHCRHSAHMIQG